MSQQIIINLTFETGGSPVVQITVRKPFNIKSTFGKTKFGKGYYGTKKEDR